MRKTLLLVLLSFFGMKMAAQGTLNSKGTLSVENAISLTPGASADEKTGCLTISFNEPGGHLFTAYQMDIYLPDGVEFFQVKNGRQMVYTKLNGNEDFYTDHTISSEIQQDGHLRLLCSSMTNDYFFEANGTLCNVYVKASPYVKPGDFQVNIKEIKFVSPDETKYLYENQILTAGTVTAESILPIKITSANKISTAILPFSCDIPGGLEVYAANGVDEDYITLERQEGITAFTPYILYAENGIDETLSGTVEAANYPETGEVSDGYITGVLKNTEVTTGYILQNKGEAPMFYKIGSTPFTIPAGKCYANPRSSNASALSFQLGEENVDGIQSTTALPTQGQNNVYDLQGKRVLNPQSGHIYVINGQKVLKR